MSKEMIFMKDGVEYMKLCMDLTVYWTGSVFGHADGVLSFYNGALSVIGDQLRFYTTEEMSHAQDLTRNDLDILPRWLREPDHTRDVLMLTLDGNTVPDLPSNLMVDFWAFEDPEEQAAGLIRLVLPVGFLSPDEFVRLARRLVGDMRFHSGHGGYAINWDYKGEYAFPARIEMAVLSKRYPAVELPEAAVTLLAIPYGLKRVNWLTLVGDSLLENLENRDAIIQHLIEEPDISGERLAHGILLVAGSEPKLGDVNRQDDLGSYHKVGASLAGLRSKEHPPYIFDVQSRMPDDEVTESWLSYFDE